MAKTHLTYGLITALAMIVVGLVLHVADLSYEPWAQWITMVVFLIGILMNAAAYSKANNHVVTFGSVFSSGFKATALITILMIVWAFISITIFPEIKDKAMEKAVADMQEQGLDDEAIDQALGMTSKYFNVFMIGGIILMHIIAGLIFSLIGAAIAKKNPPPSPQFDSL